MARGGYRQGAGPKKGSKFKPRGQTSTRKIKAVSKLIRVLKKLCKNKEIALSRADGKMCQCEWCGKEWKSEIKKGPKKFCSDECRKQSRKNAAELHGCWKNNTCEECGKVFRTQNDSKYCSGECWGRVNTKQAKERHTYTCKKCGKEFSRPPRRVGDTTPVYCSRQCAGVGEVGKATTVFGKDRGSYRRRAKFYGVGYEHVKITGIFIKHNWTCQICGCPTPETLRGSKRHNAPEIDHIVPLSRGGSHTEVNLQGSCRKCNREKGNTI